MSAPGPLYTPRQRNTDGYGLAERSAIDVITGELRDLDWRPAREYLCGCQPTALCPIHAERRAIDHYHPETIR